MAVLSWQYEVTDLPPPDVAGESLVFVGRKDYALDMVTGDLAIPVRLVTGVEAVAQRLAIRMGFWQGDWFLDQREGVNYLQNVFVRNPDLTLLESFFRRVITTCPGVSKLLNYAHEIEKPTRTYKARARVLVGATTVILANQPFIVGAS